MSLLVSKEDIVKRINALDEKISEEFKPPKEKSKLIIVGGAAFILKHNLDRATKDIDALGIEGDLVEYARKYSEPLRINGDCAGQIVLQPDYKERLVEYSTGKELEFFNTYILGDYDLIISKFARGLPRDREDIIESDILEGINKEKLDILMNDALVGVPGEKRIKNEWKHFKKRHF